MTARTFWHDFRVIIASGVIGMKDLMTLGADFFATVADVKEKLGANPAIMALPIGVESSFKGIVLLLEQKAFVWQLFWPQTSVMSGPAEKRLYSKMEP